MNGLPYMVVLIFTVGAAFCIAADVTRNAQSYIHFQYQIETNVFTSSAKPNLQFRASAQNMPDLPNWLRLEQRSPMQPAFLYGTPTAKDIGQVFLEIIAWNKDDYSTIKKIMRITIEPKQASQVRYQTDFKVSNFDLADFLTGKKYLSMLPIVRSSWPNAFQVTKIDKTVNRPGGRYTRTGVKEGVYITIGSENIQPTGLKNAKYCANEIPNQGSRSVHNSFVGSEFTVSWCQLSFIELSLTSTGQQVATKDPQASFDQSNSKYLSVPFDSNRELLSKDLVFFSIPIVVGLIFLLILTYVMCCKREGLSKRNAKTPREQLQHHQSLRRATYRMRTMNANDNPEEEVAPSDGTYSYGRLDEDGYNPTPKRGTADRNPAHSLPSTPGTQRSVPPPYRMPPSMPSDQVSDTDSDPSRPPPYKKPDEGRW